jgi:outer membrane protein assembly factor BamE (lipoprotein component of BamABCDE complex)
MQVRFIGLKAAVGGAALLLLSACVAQYRSHGYVPPDDVLSEVVVGVDTRATVEDVVGAPTTTGVQNDSGFYYVGSEVRSYAYKAPEVIDRTVVAISFDEAGVVSNIKRYGLEDGRIVPLKTRITQTTDGDISFIRKLFGNIGRLSAEDLLGDS